MINIFNLFKRHERLGSYNVLDLFKQTPFYNSKWDKSIYSEPGDFIKQLSLDITKTIKSKIELDQWLLIIGNYRDFYNGFWYKVYAPMGMGSYIWYHGNVFFIRII